MAHIRIERPAVSLHGCVTVMQITTGVTGGSHITFCIFRKWYILYYWQIIWATEKLNKGLKNNTGKFSFRAFNIQARLISQKWKSCLPNVWVINDLYLLDAFHTCIGKKVRSTGNLQHWWPQSYKIYTGFHSHLLVCSTKLHDNRQVMQHHYNISVCCTVHFSQVCWSYFLMMVNLLLMTMQI